MNYNTVNYFDIPHQMEFLSFDMNQDTTPFIFQSNQEIKVYHILLLSGDAVVRFGANEHILKAGKIASFFGRSDFSVTSVSDDASGYYLSINENYMPTLLKSHDPFSPSFILRTQKNPVFSLEDYSYTLISERLATVGAILRDTTHFFRNVMLELALLMFLMEVGNMFLKQDSTEPEHLERDRKRELFLEFMKIVRSSGNKRLSVREISGRLCVTAQYLNRIVSACSDRSVTDWLNMNITNELIHSLHFENQTIQQIADKFGFPDQATLSKFFKRQTGLSPTMYRKKHSISTSSQS